MYAILLFLALVVFLALFAFPPRRFLGSGIRRYQGGGDYSLDKISKGNIVEVRRIEVEPAQQKFVATITDSLVQASFLEGWRGYALRYKGAVVGFGSYADYEKKPVSTKVYKMIIDKAHQGQGHGRALLSMMLDRIAGERGQAHDVWIDPDSDNAPAIGLYKKFFDVVSDDGRTTMMKLRR